MVVEGRATFQEHSFSHPDFNPWNTHRTAPGSQGPIQHSPPFIGCVWVSQTDHPDKEGLTGPWMSLSGHKESGLSQLAHSGASGWDSRWQYRHTRVLTSTHHLGLPGQPEQRTTAGWLTQQQLFKFCRLEEVTVGFFWGLSPWLIHGLRHPVSSQSSLHLYLNLLLHGHQL